MSSTKQIAKNTLLLYFRQVLIILVSLYSVRVILDVVGIEDYGVYNVVAGVVTLFGFLSGAMATASQRFFSYDIGKGDPENLRITFNVTFYIYLLIVVLMIVLAESVGLWFVCKKMVIPPDRIIAAKWIYQFSILGFAVTLITTPYIASIIAHENMQVYAYASIVEAVLKLSIVFLLKVLPFDKLILYGFLLFAVSLINTAIYRVYCKQKYYECRIIKVWNGRIFGEIMKFTGWSIFGAFTSMARTQAITVLVNQFFSPVVVAARVISSQVTNMMTVFSSNFNTSLYAPIVKEYAADRKDAMFSLVFMGSKVTFFLMWIFSLPLLIRMEFFLTLWLKNVPDYVVLFTRLSIVEVLINSISFPTMTAARASGKVKLYELTLGSLQLMMFIVSYVWIRYFYGEAVIVYYVAIIINIMMFITRLIILKKLVNFPLAKYLSKVVPIVCFIMVVSSIISLIVDRALPLSFIGSSGLIITSLLVSSALMYFIGLDKKSKQDINKTIKNRFVRA